MQPQIEVKWMVTWDRGMAEAGSGNIAAGARFSVSDIDQEQ